MAEQLKEDVVKHTEELRSVHEAAAVSCSSQLEMIDNIRGTQQILLVHSKQVVSLESGKQTGRICSSLCHLRSL